MSCFNPLIPIIEGKATLIIHKLTAALIINKLSVETELKTNKATEPLTAISEITNVGIKELITKNKGIKLNVATLFIGI